MGYELQATDYRPEATDYRLQTTGYGLQEEKNRWAGSTYREELK
jgi:hypothetical protein